MNKLYRYKYIFLTVLVIAAALAAILGICVPYIMEESSNFQKLKGQRQLYELASKQEISADSLLSEYRDISGKINSLVRTSVSSSEILMMIHGKAAENNVNMIDLTTQESLKGDGRIEYPVSFKAVSEYTDFLRFIEALENEAFCISVNSIDMSGNGSGKVTAAVRLAVLGGEQ
ncbi:hypothetical protein [Fibrobacter sp. UWR2]|uniref:hypothetical protein n=1 Tax=Fibrobacter sp. UWR2 TaxID=1964352 RepID=UPI000B524BA1|nr:hypothetical protein [Fibrobacter sp. UWR2]OWV02114.1 hypothetical protein B7994_02575 [Fibrobacter sp. UWR2]